MAGKFLELNEAAQMLGVTPEQLIEMRSRGTIFGYRDGSSWKFKQEEVERVLQEQSGEDDAESEILTADDHEFENFVTGLSSKIQANQPPEDDQESILLSEDELTSGIHGGSGSMKSGSVIRDGSDKDGDIQLAADSNLGGDAMSRQGAGKPSDILSGSSPNIVGGTDLMSGGPGAIDNDSIKLGDDGELSLDDLDDLSLGSVSGDDDLGELSFADEDASSHSSESGSSPGMSGSDIAMSEDDDYSLASDDISAADDDLALGEAPSAPSVEGDSAGDFDLGLDDELSVLGEEGPPLGRGSDVTHGGGDSGINLAPSDGGLSLEEEPLDLGGSAIESSLELPEDDDVIELENAADPDQATQLKADDQFMLSPSDAIGEEESDSGSQVIALEDSESFDQDAATMLNAQNQMGGAALVADESAFGQPGMMTGPGASGAYQGAYAPQPVEIPYSIWQVLSLFILAGILTVSGMLMIDVMQNMWTWEGNGSAATFVMDAVISTVGLDK